MKEIVRTLGTPRMIASLEATLEEEMMCFGRGLVGGEMYNDGEIEGFFTGRGHLNGILRTHLRKQDATSVEQSIKRVLSYFQEKQTSDFGWSVGQDCQPVAMGAYLEQHGFYKLKEENIGMALDIAGVSVETVQLADFEIREVEDTRGLAVLRNMEIEGFGSSEELAQHYYEMYEGVGFGKHTVWRHFVGQWQGDGVASTSLLFHEGVAGIFGVTTLPAARRRGFARAMVLHAIEEARAAGYQIAILSPTDMSERIYQRLGFREYTRIRHYRYA